MKARFRSPGAFTLIELLTVMAVIAILAGLVLGTAGYVQKAAARKRASAEIAAMEAALESYKADNGVYPRATNQTAPPGSPSLEAARALFQALSGDGNKDLEGGSGESPDGKLDDGAKRYMEFKPSQLAQLDANKNPTGDTYVQDPFGSAYGYYVPDLNDPSGPAPMKYNPTFDLWSKVGAGTDAEDEVQYQKNW